LLGEGAMREAARPGFVRAAIIHLLHALLGRLGIAQEQGNPWSVFRGRWDMKPFLILNDESLAGCCFLLQHNATVWELGIIGVRPSMARKGIGSMAVEEVRKYAASKGAKTLITRASGLRHATGFFERCGFKRVYSERYLSFAVYQHGEGAGAS
jgi:N-acetylglutamate synthase-like GNAT family acetyltransferase